MDCNESSAPQWDELWGVELCELEFSLYYELVVVQ